MLNGLKFHHLGFVVKSLDNAISEWKNLGYCIVGNIFYDNIQNNKLIFMTNNDITIELLEPIDNTSSIYNAPYGFHHICFSVCDKNFEKKFKELNIGKIYTKKILAPALNNAHICFAYLRLGVNLEFILLES